MFSEKILINVLVFAWKLFRFMLLGARKRKLVTQTALADSYPGPRRANYGSGLTWMTVLALIVIGIPLANADPDFRTIAGHDVQSLVHAVADAWNG